MNKDNVGVLIPIFSLPSRHGIGDFGQESYAFIRWLNSRGYKYWQLLPLNPIGPGNSPYMSICSEALEYRYISLDSLVDMGLLKSVPNFRIRTSKVDYQKVGEFKDKYLREAFSNYQKLPKNNLSQFKKEHPWVMPFAIFSILRKKMNYQTWIYWPKEYKFYLEKETQLSSDMITECDYLCFTQMIAYEQWNKLRKFAHENNVSIIADCPFYVGLDSVDCWLHKDEFMMDENYHPTLVSGCPPDAFSDTGQLWGTPIYDFQKMKRNDYAFLVDRIGYLSSNCDILRLDHFRAFDTYCVIPSEDFDASRGVWWEGPKHNFFDALYKKYPQINLIAEDLGELFLGVHKLRDDYNLPGMNVLQFSVFDDQEMPSDNKIVYPGTHDNHTLLGWIKSLSNDDKEFLKKKLNKPKDMFDAFYQYAWEHPSKITIFPFQDLLRLDDKSRINTPGTISENNWSFRLKDFALLHSTKYGNQ